MTTSTGLVPAVGARAFRRLKPMVERATTPAMKRRLLRLRDGLLDGWVRQRALRGQLGPLPHFLIIGSQKCGTTYLYDLLSQHPAVRPALTKEIHFFDFNAHKGATWYRACFPTLTAGLVTGEASPYYIFHPRVPRLIAELVPSVKLIALLRDPVSRAYSHFHHNVRLGFESLSFEEALEQEPARLAGERERMLADERYISYNHAHFGYATRGIYADQLPAWQAHFAPEQLLILQSEAFYRDTPAVLQQVTDFLGLPPFPLDTARAHRPARYPKLDMGVRDRLAASFAPHNQRLYDALGVPWRW